MWRKRQPRMSWSKGRYGSFQMVYVKVILSAHKRRRVPVMHWARREEVRFWSLHLLFYFYSFQRDIELEQLRQRGASPSSMPEEAVKVVEKKV